MFSSEEVCVSPLFLSFRSAVGGVRHEGFEAAQEKVDLHNSEVRILPLPVESVVRCDICI